MMKPYLDSTPVQSDANELRCRLERDGYLALRQIIPAAVLEDLRLKLLAIARDGGWVRKDAPLADGIADLDGFCLEPEPRYMDVYHRMYRLPEFHAVQHHPNLLGVFERMFHEPILPHPRIIGRSIFPRRVEYTTPPHQDFVPIQGTTETFTAWVPLSDITPDLGGLQLCVGSHRGGVYDFRPALGASGMEIVNMPTDDWVGGSMQQGDVLIFHSLTVHKGLPNTSDRIRMSLDTRFQRAREPIAPDSLEPHGKELLTWPEIYADWPSTDLQYYWRKWDLQVKPYDNQYIDRRDALAFEMAEAKDPQARSTLQRIIARDPDPAKRSRASSLLAQLDAQ